MGTVLVAIIRLWFFQESIVITKVMALVLIIIGVVMLHSTSD